MSYLKTAPKRYFIEVMAACLLMAVIVWLRQVVTRSTGDPALILMAKLLPILPVLIIGVAVYRLYRRQDEFQQQVILKSTAAGGLLTMLVFLAYAPLNALGLPPFSRQIGLFILAACYLLCLSIVGFLNLRAMSGTRQALIHLAPMAIMPLLPAAYWVFSLFLPVPPLSFRLGLALFGAGGILFGFYRIFIRPVDL